MTCHTGAAHVVLLTIPLTKTELFVETECRRQRGRFLVLSWCLEGCLDQFCSGCQTVDFVRDNSSAQAFPCLPVRLKKHVLFY